jgi:hypothetical protein
MPEDRNNITVLGAGKSTLLGKGFLMMEGWILTTALKIQQEGGYLWLSISLRTARLRSMPASLQWVFLSEYPDCQILWSCRGRIILVLLELTKFSEVMCLWNI